MKAYFAKKEAGQLKGKFLYAELTCDEAHLLFSREQMAECDGQVHLTVDYNFEEYETKRKCKPFLVKLFGSQIDLNMFCQVINTGI